MPLYNNPVRLERLSLDAVGNYVTELSTRLVKSTVSAKDRPYYSLLFRWCKTVFCHTNDPQGEDSSLGLCQAEEVCKRLRHVLQVAVVRKLVNRVTSELLNNLDMSDSSHRSGSAPCERILQKLVYASLHSDLTELDVTYRRISSFVVSRMWTMGNLKRLRITSCTENETWLGDVKRYMHAFPYLEKFSYRINCTDDILKILCRSSRYLKCLDVSGSHGVTDDSVQSFLGLVCLEELNLICTEVSEKGYVELINGLAQRAVCIRQPRYIKNIGCDCYSDTQLRILVTGLVNVREVSLRMCDLSSTVSTLKHLEYLRVLRLKYCFFSDVNDLLRTIGCQLLELELENSGNLDVAVICENCPSLVKLVLMERTYKCENCGSFPSLRHLVLQTREPSAVACLLSGCHSLTTLQLCTVQEFYEHHVASVLERNRLQRLQSLSIGTLSGCVSPGTIGILSEHCVNLSEFSVFGEPGVGMKHLCQLYPGLQVDADLWSRLVDKEAILNAKLDLDQLLNCG